jgi:hypothetical protein
MALSGSERQRRYIAKLKDAAAGITTQGFKRHAPAAASVIDVPAIVSWWKAAGASQRELLCAEIGSYDLTCAMLDDAGFQECIDEFVKIDLRDRAADYGYQPIEEAAP